MPAYGDPVCFRCQRCPDEIDEYIQTAREESITPNDVIWDDEGTYNPAFNTFCCTQCYIAIGMPTAPHGWKAPQRGTKVGNDLKEEEGLDFA